MLLLPKVREDAFVDLQPTARMRVVKGVLSAAFRSKKRLESPDPNTPEKPTTQEGKAAGTPVAKKPAAKPAAAKPAAAKPKPAVVKPKPKKTKAPLPPVAPQPLVAAIDKLEPPFTVTIRNHHTDKRGRGEAYILQAAGIEIRQLWPSYENLFQQIL